MYLEKKKPSRQDGGVGRYTLPPYTTKRTTMNLKAKTNQNCQKIKLYGSPTTKELKKKHSSRSVGGVEMGSQGREDAQQGRGWRTHIYLHVDKPRGTTGERDRPPNPRFQCREIKASEPLAIKTSGG